MGWPVCNTTLEDEKIHETPLWDNGMTFHHLGILISAAFALLSVAVSLFLIFMHATHYLRPQEQRHIIRILFMVPVYSLVSWLSFYHYRHAVYFEVLRDCYEAFAISAFFSLLCNYVASDLHSQKQYFRGIVPKPWLWPLNWFKKCCGGERGIWRTPRSGLTFFNIIWTGVFQYCFIRVAMTVVAVITQKFDRYCQESLNPAFAHIWVMVFEASCVTIAMYCLIQFYYQLRADLAQHSPFLKILAIKLVIFLSFWQEILISFLTSSGAIKTSDKMQMPDVKIGIPSTLLCFEMSLFAILHLWAFPWRPYTYAHSSPLAAAESSLDLPSQTYQGGFLGIKALFDAFNPWDLVKAIGRSAKWLFVGRKKRQLDPSYQGQPGTSFNLKPTSPTTSPPHISTFSPTTDAPGPYPDTPGLGAYGAHEGEGEELLAHAQPVPMDYPYRPSGDIGTAGSEYRYSHEAPQAYGRPSMNYEPYHSQSQREL